MKQDKRRPNTFKPLAAGPHNGVDPTCFLHAQVCLYIWLHLCLQSEVQAKMDVKTSKMS